MSEVLDKPVIKEKEPLLTKKDRKLLTDPLDDNNPITVQVLGICSALAVTSQLKPSLIMAVCVIFVLALANMITSMIRKIMPGRIRMIVQLLVIATLVTVVDIFLKAFLFDVSKQLSVFIGLIITNCIVMGRLEAFAMGNKPLPSFLDGIGNGLGYGLILIIVGATRELFGTGKLLGYTLINAAEGSFLHSIGYQHNGIMATTPASAMFIIGILIWIQRARKPQLVDIS